MIKKKEKKKKSQASIEIDSNYIKFLFYMFYCNVKKIQIHIHSTITTNIFQLKAIIIFLLVLSNVN